MRLYIGSLLVLGLICTVSCQSGPDPVATLQAEVIAVHDEVMPMMGTMTKFKNGLQARADGMITAEADSAALAPVYEAISTLESADRNMMQWMRDFSPPTAEIPEAEALGYLKEEMKKITIVKEQAESGLAQAKELLKKEK